MDKKGRGYKETIRQMVESLDMPAEVLLGLPHLEMEGDREILIDRHKGIIEYLDECIRIASKDFSYEITGLDLTIIAMNKTQLRIRGTIREIKEGTFMVEIANGVIIEIARGAVNRVLAEGEKATVDEKN